ncbi:MAG: hypothetical protein JNK57_07655 [Planctomycetaceae bacterium]|nr:hypothetical protein [Planctomycetaceae bacterium]
MDEGPLKKLVHQDFVAIALAALVVSLALPAREIGWRVWFGVELTGGSRTLVEVVPAFQASPGRVAMLTVAHWWWFSRPIRIFFDRVATRTGGSRTPAEVVSAHSGLN